MSAAFTAFLFTLTLMISPPASNPEPLKEKIKAEFAKQKGKSELPRCQHHENTGSN